MVVIMKKDIKNNKKVTKLHKEKILNLYTNPSHPGSFSGINSFYRVLKQKDQYLKKDDLLEILKSQETYTLHRPKSKIFSRNKVKVYGIDDTWQIDLCDMRNFQKENDNYCYILTIIDVFSKQAWAIKLKNKKGDTILEELKNILKERKPKRIHADQGTEFFNKDCINYLNKNGIKLYYTNSEMKAQVVERFNRTLKEKMWRYFTYVGNQRYVDILDKLVDSYNNTYHRSIKTFPYNVNEKNSEIIFMNLYGYKKNSDYEPNLINIKYKEGDFVRLSKSKKLFEKGYTKNWTREIFIIHKIIINPEPTYIVKDQNNDILEGVFYEKELQQVNKNDNNVYEIDEIIKTRVVNKKKEFLVSWKGYPSSFNSWVKEKDLG